MVSKRHYFRKKEEMSFDNLSSIKKSFLVFFFDVCGFFYLAKSRVWCGVVLGNHPIGKSGFMWSGAPGAVVGVRPRSRPGAAVADNIFHTQVVFIQLCLFSVTAAARGTDDHFVATPRDPGLFSVVVAEKRTPLPSVSWAWWSENYRLETPIIPRKVWVYCHPLRTRVVRRRNRRAMDIVQPPYIASNNRIET